MCGDIHLESPENLTWPDLNKPAARKFGATMSQKTQFLGSGPFSERGLIRATDTIFGKSEKYVPGYLSGVPKKTYMAKIEQTHDPQI